MKKLLFFLFLIIFLTNVKILFSQEYIWGGPGDPNSEFNGGLNDWTTKAVSPNDSARWVWEADGKADKGKWWYGREPIASPSVDNGAAVFDSDYYDTGGTNGNSGDGPAPYPQTGELISPAFSCENYNNVYVKFNQYYRTWHGGTKLAVSIDGGETWVYEITLNKDIILNYSTSRYSEKIIDISSVAAKQAEVKIKFIWEGGYYFWIIDDVYVLSNPPADPQILGTWYPPASFNTPQYIISHDSLKFKMRVRNAGEKSMNNIMGIVEIVNRDNLETYYTDSTFFNLNHGDTIDINFNSYSPPVNIDTGLYVAVYSIVTSGSATLENKTYWQNFRIGSNELNNSDLCINWKYRTADDYADYSYSYQGSTDNGPIYDVYYINKFKTGSWVDNPNIRFRATSVSLAMWMSTPNPDDKISFPVNAYLFEVADTIKDDLSNFMAKDGIVVDGNESKQLTYIGYSAENAENVDKYELRNFQLSSADDEYDYIDLKPGKKYFVGVFWPKGTRYYQTVDNHYAGIVRYFYPDQIISLRYADYGDGSRFYNISRDIGAWQIGLNSTFTVVTKDNTLPEKSVIIKQNPVRKNLEVELKFENGIKKATMVLHDLKGNILNIRNIEDVKTQIETFDVSGIPPGTYIFTIFTKNKLLSKKFIVIK